MSALEWDISLTEDPSHRRMHLPDSEDKKQQGLIVVLKRGLSSFGPPFSNTAPL